jgi:hypothetical protein
VKKWIYIPGAGEFLGEGTWHEVRGDLMEQDFAACKAANSLPAVWEVSEAEIIADPRGKEPNFIMRAGMLVHQFHRVAIAIPAVADQRAIQFARLQLKDFLEKVLAVDGTVNKECSS